MNALAVRIPIPAPLALPLAIVGGILITLLVVTWATDPRRRSSPGTTWGGLIVGGIAAGLATLMLLPRFVPIHLLHGASMTIALLLAVAALALTIGQKAYVGAGIAAGGGVLLAYPLLRLGGFYMHLVIPPLVPLLVATVIFVRHARARP